MATRGSLGGLALATADVALVLEASGKDVLLIETVGVGQDEIEIARLADIILVVLVPGMGDDVQSLKAGVMEIADLYVINKSDREGVDRVEQEIRAPAVPRADHPDWTPPIVRTIATTGDGIDALAAAIARNATVAVRGKPPHRSAAPNNGSAASTPCSAPNSCAAPADTASTQASRVPRRTHRHRPARSLATRRPTHREALFTGTHYRATACAG